MTADDDNTNDWRSTLATERYVRDRVRSLSLKITQDLRDLRKELGQDVAEVQGRGSVIDEINEEIEVAKDRLACLLRAVERREREKAT